MKFVNGSDPDVQKLAFQAVEDSEGGYPTTISCCCCKAPGARLIGVVDDEPGQELCSQPKPEGMKYWPHDSCSIGIYLCGECLEVTGKFTQG